MNTDIYHSASCQVPGTTHPHQSELYPHTMCSNNPSKLDTQVWRHALFIPVLGRQRHHNVCEFRASLAHTKVPRGPELCSENRPK